MEIEITNKTEEEIEELKEEVPDGHIEEREDKIYWVFEYDAKFGV